MAVDACMVAKKLTPIQQQVVMGMSLTLYQTPKAFGCGVQTLRRLCNLGIARRQYHPVSGEVFRALPAILAVREELRKGAPNERE